VVVEADGGCYHLEKGLWIRFLMDEGVFNVLLEVQLIQEDEGFIALSWEVSGDELELCSVICDRRCLAEGIESAFHCTL